MTATAQSSEDEFKRFYNLDIVVIQPNRSCIRKDLPDRIFKNKAAKNKAVSDEILTIHRSGRPVLVGTGSVEESERLSEDLRKKEIDCVVLNAKNDEYEAGIIAEAGRLSAVTISTNMAGRGTDIRLGGADERERKQVVDLGGLYVIGLNRHESKRIDQQLRGRAGRQGDPGASRFFVSLTDDIFQKYRLPDILPKKIFQCFHHGEIENRIISREMNRIQRIVEGQNLEIKKTLSKCCFLVEQQREIFVRQREKLLIDDEHVGFFQSNCSEQYNMLLKRLGKEKTAAFCRDFFLHFIDQTWSQYLVSAHPEIG